MNKRRFCPHCESFTAPVPVCECVIPSYRDHVASLEHQLHAVNHVRDQMETQIHLLRQGTDGFTAEITEMRANLKTAEDLLMESNADVVALQRNNRCLERDLETAKSIIAGMDQANQRFSQAPQELRTQVAFLDLKLAAAQLTNSSLEKRLHTANTTIAELKKEKVAIEEKSISDLSTVANENAELKQELSTAANCVKNLGELLSNSETHVNLADETLAKAHAEAEHFKQKLQCKLAEAHAEIDHLKQKLAAELTKVEQLKLKLENMEKAGKLSDEKLTKALACIQQLNQRVIDLDGKDMLPLLALSEARAELVSSQNECSKAKSDLLGAQAKVATLKETVSGAETVNGHLTADLAKARTDLTKARNQLKYAQGRNEKLQADLSTATSDVAGLKEKLSASEKRVADGVDLANSARQKITELLHQLQANNQQYESSHLQLKRDIDTANAKIADLYGELTTAQQSNASFKDSLQAAYINIGALNDEKLRYQQTTTANSQRLAAQKEESEKLKAENLIHLAEIDNYKKAVADFKQTIAIYEKQQEKFATQPGALMESLPSTATTPPATPPCQCERLSPNEELLLRAEFEVVKDELAEQREIMLQRQAQSYRL